MSIVLPLLVFLFPLAYSPGPGNMTFAANGARFGFAATLPANLGYHIATLCVALAMGFGALSLLNAVPWLFTALKIAGALYVLWLAIGFLRAELSEDARRPRPISFADGVVLLVLNPKAYLIMALMFSQFLNGEDLTTVVVIATVFTLNNLLAFCVWTLAGDVLLRAFRSPGAARRMNTGFGVALALTAVWMLLA
ncbi:LysE family translocator [Sagittula sp. NFXS13]|uniref:LysE family translocator n=1 Tax=Sagittula sp. NFXS13 TaxID=2819095 RepID=UPI0032DF80C9